MNEQVKQEGQRPRLSYTLAYKGIVVGGASSYHPEKVDFSMTKTVDYIEGESEEDTEKRIQALETLEELLCTDVEGSIMAKVKQLKKGKK